MNKPDLIAKVAEKTDSTKKDAEAHVNAVFDTIQESLAAGEDCMVYSRLKNLAICLA